MVNYEVDPALLKSRVPAGITLDLADGKCFVSLVGFMFLETRVLDFLVPFHVNFEEVPINESTYIKLRLKDAAEFLTRKDYTDNWQSEMHETFCFWDFLEWKANLQKVGFTIHSSSKAFTNDWIVQNRWKDKAELFTVKNGVPEPVDYPVTTMFLIGVKA